MTAKRTAIVLLAACLIALCSCTTETEQPTASEVTFAYVHDWAEPKVPEGMVRIALESQEKQQEATQDAQTQEVEYIADFEQEYAYSGLESPTYNGNANGLNSFDGVYSYGGHLETYYASYAAYDNQLWVDDEGFFRNSDGRYVVSTDDYAQGEIIEISKGEAIVMDCSTAPGVVDVHTTWGR